MLELEGLAVTIPRRGAMVAKMTEKDMEDVLQIRRCLDDLAVRLSCEKMTQEQLKALYLALKKFEESTRSRDVKQIAQADVEFHDTIYKAADNPKLLTLLNNLREQMYRYRLEYLKDVSVYPELIAEHQEIYDGLARKDKEQVIRITNKHIMNQAIVVKNIIREQE